MGYGAYMHIKNSSNIDLKTYVTDVDCMYDDGHENSNLSVFNDAIIPAGTNLPTSGSQYIEAKNSGSCFLADSKFSLKIMTCDGTGVSVIHFRDSSANWRFSQTPPDPVGVNVYVNNSGSQATITITVYHAGTGVPHGDDMFDGPAAYVAPSDGSDLKKGTAGHDAQNRRTKGADEA